MEWKKTSAYAIKNMDSNIRKKCASGGVFEGIASYAIDRDGVVYGVAYDDSFKVQYRRAETKEALEMIYGSKYVQCIANNVFHDVLLDLKQGREVVFSGTPCQVNGLKNFLRREYENLILCDIVCHGCPSPQIYDDFLQRLPGCVTNLSFRQKELGWNKQKWSVKVNNKIYAETVQLMSYKNIYYQRVAHRPACYQCPFATVERSSDITIGDYWGIENIVPGFADDLGVSLVLIHSEKGKQVMEAISNKFDIIETSKNACLQPQLKRPVERPKTRMKFWELYRKEGYDACVKEFSPISIIQKIISHMPYRLYRWMIKRKG